MFADRCDFVSVESQPDGDTRRGGLKPLRGGLADKVLLLQTDCPADSGLER